MATRRMASSSHAMSFCWPLGSSTRRRSSSGSTRPLRDHDRQRHEIDDHHGGGGRQPADERQQRDGLGPRRQRQGEHEGVGIEGALGQAQQAGRGNRHHEQVDQHQVDREQPGGAADLLLRVVLDHGHMELPRQQHDAHEAEERHRDPAAAVEAAGEDAAGSRGLCWTRSKNPPKPPNTEKMTKKPTARKAASLTRDSAATATIRPSWCSVASMWRVPNRTANVAIVRAMMKAVSVGRLSVLQRARAQQRVDRKRHRLQLQGDVGQRAGDGDDGDDGGDRLALAVAGGQEVGDRGDVLALGQAHDAQQEAPAEHEQQDRPEIDGDEIVAGGGGKADAAEERPGGAVDGQRQGIDQRPAVAGLAEAAGPVGIPRQREQDTHVSQRQRDDAPTFDHACTPTPRPPGQAAVSRREYRASNASTKLPPGSRPVIVLRRLPRLSNAPRSLTALSGRAVRGGICRLGLTLTCRATDARAQDAAEDVT